MAAEPSTKARAWAIFDRIVDDAAPGGEHSNPWQRTSNDKVIYQPDFDTLIRLLGVPLFLRAATTTGVPALALDVWVSYEMRRAGFDGDAVWPRATAPRIMPAPIARLLKLKWAKPDLVKVSKKIHAKTPPAGVVASTANILGKNYLKQVDVVMSDWATGPELLISTKRMDSSFGKNAANRVEESYGDAKNLRLRHPMAALGFVYGLRSTILTQEKDKADWLIDLLQKLGREDDAYHAVCLLMIEYGAELIVDEDPDATAEDDDALIGAGLGDDESFETDDDEGVEAVEPSEVETALAGLPPVVIRHDEVPDALQPARFLAEMVRRVLDATPVTHHKEARARLHNPRERDDA